jgi:hypothetical protein
MSKPSITIYDHATGDTVVREMDDIEYAEHLLVIEEVQAAKNAAQLEADKTEINRASATSKLEALGLSADDLKALGL